MVHKGIADGMVSGAAHTTAHTIRPSFEIIKTAPGVSTVSSVFLMCLSDRVLAYGDCAVVPDPTAEQLADIAISSAAHGGRSSASIRGSRCCRIRPANPAPAPTWTRCATATATGARTSPGPVGGGADSVRRRGRADGREREAARIREVAGRATVFVFPDLNTGNNTYKAVQRSAGAVAVGPVLQGLTQAGERSVPRCVGPGHRQYRRDHGDPGAGGSVDERTVLFWCINSGSSSIKFQLVDPVAREPWRTDSSSGSVSRTATDRDSQPGRRRSTRRLDIADHAAGLRRCREVSPRPARRCASAASSPSVIEWCTAARCSTARPDRRRGGRGDRAAVAPLRRCTIRRTCSGSRWRARTVAGRSARRCVRHRVLSHAARRGRDVCDRLGGGARERHPTVRIPRHLTRVRVGRGRGVPGPRPRGAESDRAAPRQRGVGVGDPRAARRSTRRWG